MNYQQERDQFIAVFAQRVDSQPRPPKIASGGYRCRCGHAFAPHDIKCGGCGIADPWKANAVHLSQGPGGIVLARALLRASTTLQRLAAAQCNGDWPYDNGEREVQPCGRCEAGTVPSQLIRAKHCDDCAGTGHAPIGTPQVCDTCDGRGALGGVCPDCRAQDRVRKLLAGSGWVPYFQGDPRGCVLYLHPDDGRAGEQYTGNHPDAISVPGGDEAMPHDTPTEPPARAYNIVRMYQRDGINQPRLVKARVTLEEAQAHCRDPETSWRTCTRAAGRRRTKVHGPWFDGYEER